MEPESPTPADYPDSTQSSADGSTAPARVRDIPSAPSGPPRALIPAVKRAIWLEPRVRLWIYLILLTVLMFGGFCADSLWERHRETDLIANGAKVEATIIYAENKQTNMPFGSGDKAHLTVHWPGGDEDLADVFLSNGGVMGHKITLHIDKADHARWTDRSEPTPVFDSLIVGLMGLPIVPVLAFFAYRKMRALRRTWQNGDAALAVVVERKQSPIAPLSYAVRCSMADLRTRDIFTVYVPRVGYGLENGDTIWVIAPPRGGLALAALWMPAEGANAGSSGLP